MFIIAYTVKPALYNDLNQNLHSILSTDLIVALELGYFKGKFWFGVPLQDHCNPLQSTVYERPPSFYVAQAPEVVVVGFQITRLLLGTGTFCQHSFGNNRSIKAGSMMLA